MAWLLAQHPPGAGWSALSEAVLPAAHGLIVCGHGSATSSAAVAAARQKRLIQPVSRYGVTGRGAALVLIGFYLVAAAIDGQSAEAHELGGGLQHLRHTAMAAIAVLLFALAFAVSGFFDFSRSP